MRADARKRRPALPRQIPPRRHEEDYAGVLVRIVNRARAAWAPVTAALARLSNERKDAGESQPIGELAHKAAIKMRAAFDQAPLDALARKFAKRTASYQRKQLTKQVRAGLGVDPILRDKGLAARVDKFAAENVALVKTIPDRLHGELQRIVQQAVAAGRQSGGRGSSPDTLRADIEDRFDVSESRARVIARDQIGKFYAGVNHARQQELGIDRFVWRTSGDERVRGAPGGKYPDAEPSHYDLDGNVYDYDDPPEAGTDGEPALPGEAIQCRCWAEPVLDDLESDDTDEDVESDDEDED